MNQKRTVVVAGALSALLLSASAAFAVGSGLFSSGAADKVGTFQAIEQAAASRRPATNGPTSTEAGGSTSTTSGAVQSPSDHQSTSEPTSPTVGTTEPETSAPGSQPPTVNPADGHELDTTTTASSPAPTINPSTTSTSHPEHEVEPPATGIGSDD